MVGVVIIHDEWWIDETEIDCMQRNKADKVRNAAISVQCPRKPLG
jgi:hypothetical protein